MGVTIHCPECGAVVPFTQNQVLNASGECICPGCGKNVVLEAKGPTPQQVIDNAKKRLSDTIKGLNRR